MSLFRKLVGIFQAAGVALRKRLLGGLPPVYIEDLFSTWLYTGTASTQTITNGIDLSTKGGLVWYKRRNTTGNNVLVDTVRGMTSGSSPLLFSNVTDAQSALNNYLIAGTTGYSLGSNATGTDVNASGSTYVSWTFRKQPKFFDVVAYTGNGAATRAISHSLASTPGFVIIKETSTADNWHCWHRSFASFSTYIFLNSANGSTTTGGSTIFKGMSATDFTIGSDSGVNASGSTYVAYLFAHDAGGFGLSGTDNVISCGSYTGNSSTREITLGYEAQWVLIKKTNVSGDNWKLLDNMRGMPVAGTSKPSLSPNLSAGDDFFSDAASATATGFLVNGGGLTDGSDTYIYIAIRRGPMKVPTLGTSVYNAISRTGTGANATISGVGFPPDLLIECNPSKLTANPTVVFDRLRGQTLSSYTNQTSPEDTTSDSLTSFASMDGVLVGADNLLNGINVSGTSYINWFFRRAPSYLDTVCYNGTGSNTTQTHNLGVVPELMLIKSRDTATNWGVYSSAIANTEYLALNSTAAKATGATYWNSTTPTSSVFSLGTDVRVNSASTRYVAYLFATCAGVSKVGSYTGTATTLQIDCGFTGGARFVLIKRTDAIGDWYVWDSTRGIVAGNDPFLRLNSTQAETTNTDYIDTYSAGFEISSTATAAINVSGGTYIFLAIA